MNCKGTNKAGERCGNYASSGGYCRLHLEQGPPELQPYTPEWWRWTRAQRFKKRSEA